jgi:hypothetical protein
MHGVFSMAIFMSPQQHAGKSGDGIDLGVIEIKINIHFNGSQNQIPRQLSKTLCNPLIIPTAGTSHVPFPMIPFNHPHLTSSFNRSNVTNFPYRRDAALPRQVTVHGSTVQTLSYETTPGQNSEKIERRTSNVQHRTSNIDDATLYLF